MVTCKLCGKKYKVITNSHLSARHNSTIRKYSRKFGKEDVGKAPLSHTFPKDDPRYIKWRKSLKGKRIWNKGHTKESHPSVAQIARTMREKKIDNFSEWRKKARKKGIIPRTYNDFEKDSKLAFLHGMVLGDGYIQQFPRTQKLNVTLGTDKPKLWKYVAGHIQSVFRKEPSIHNRKNSHCLDIYIYEKHISERIGIPTGSRGDILVKVPSWILQEDKYLIPWLRGLYEAEGSFCVHKPTHTYKMMFCNSNESLLSHVYDSLIHLGYNPHRSSNKVQVSKRKEVYRLKDHLNFRRY